MVFWCRIPFSDKYCLKAREVYSPPLSDRSVFTQCHVWFSTSANHREKTASASPFEICTLSILTKYVLVCFIRQNLLHIYTYDILYYTLWPSSCVHTRQIANNMFVGNMMAHIGYLDIHEEWKLLT